MVDLQVRVYANHWPHQRHWCGAFADGLRAHGIEPTVTTPETAAECDLAVMWSDKFSLCKQLADEYIILEAPPIRVDGYASAGWNGAGNLADYCNDNSPGDRAERFAHLMKPYHSGEYALIMGQCRGDTAVNGADLSEWCNGVAEALEEEGIAHYFRPHPKDGGLRCDAPTLNADLESSLAGADWVITYNSTSGVDAALAGCAVSAFDERSFAWPIAGHGLDPRRSRRRQWLNNLAYCQWNNDEMVAGATWNHLKQRLV